MTRALPAAVLLALTLAATAVAANPMVHVKDCRLVNGAGTPLFLRGVFLDNWFFWTGSSWGCGLISETTILDRLRDAVGPDETERFRQRVYQTFCTEETFARIAATGFTMVRIPFNHRLLESDDAPYVYSEAGFAHLDRALDWCAKYGLYAILDLHSAPGGQSNVFVADPTPPLLWHDIENRNRTVALWKAIARRYRSRTCVLGYDLLNEPDDCKPKHLVQMYQRIIAAIREVDPHHLVMVEGLKLGSDFSMFSAPLDDNQAYAFHTYWLFPFSIFVKDEKEDQVRRLADLSRRHGCAVINTEFGAGTASWTARCVQLFERPDSGVSGWVFWPWKRTPEIGDKYRHLVGIPQPESWKRLAAWLAMPLGRRPSRKACLQALDDLLAAGQEARTTMDDEILRGLLPPK